MKNLLSKIRELPDGRRKIIFWVAMIVLALILFGLYIKYIQKKVADIKVEETKEELQIHSFEEILNEIRKIEIPKIEMPEINQETLQELERMMKEIPTETTSCQPTE